MMDSSILILVGIGLLDGLSDVPIYLGPVVLALASVKPVSNSAKFILSVFLTYLGVGFVAFVGFYELDDLLLNGELAPPVRSRCVTTS